MKHLQAGNSVVRDAVDDWSAPCRDIMSIHLLNEGAVDVKTTTQAGSRAGPSASRHVIESSPSEFVDFILYSK